MQLEANLRHPELAQSGDNRPSPISRSAPAAAFLDHVYQECFYRLHPFFNKDPTIEYAQSLAGIRYYNKYGGRYIK